MLAGRFGRLVGDKDEPLRVVSFYEINQLILNYPEDRMEEENGAGCLGIWRTPYGGSTRLVWGPVWPLEILGQV